MIGSPMLPMVPTVRTIGASGGGGGGGGGGGDLGSPVFFQYDLTADYTATGSGVPDYTTLGTDVESLFDTGANRFVVPESLNGVFATMVHSFIIVGEGGRDFIIAIERALAASPTAFVRFCEMRHTNCMGFPVSQTVLLATGDIYQFRYINSGTGVAVSEADIRNAMSVEIMSEVP